MISDVLNNTNGHRSEVEFVAATEAWVEKDLQVSSNLEFQRNWDEPMCKAFYSQLEKTLNRHKLASLVSSQKCSGAWLNCLPNSATGGLLDDESFRIAISLRLGLRFCSPHKCRCGAQIDVLGRHPLSCKLSAGRIPRHCALNNLIKRALKKSGFPSQLEPVGLDRGDGKRPDGLTIFPYKAGKCLIWDATCSDSFSPSHLFQTVTNPGWASQQAETAKIQKCQSLADSG